MEKKPPQKVIFGGVNLIFKVSWAQGVKVKPLLTFFEGICQQRNFGMEDNSSP